MCFNLFSAICIGNGIHSYISFISIDQNSCLFRMREPKQREHMTLKNLKRMKQTAFTFKSFVVHLFSSHSIPKSTTRFGSTVCGKIEIYKRKIIKKKSTEQIQTNILSMLLQASRNKYTRYTIYTQQCCYSSMRKMRSVILYICVLFVYNV